MDEKLVNILKYLRLRNLLDRWDEYMAMARKKRMSVERLMTLVLEEEYGAKCDNARLLRRQRAHIPENLEIETFPELVAELFQSLADRSEQKLLKRYASYDCLVIDEVGYVEVEPAQVGQFFTLMQKRHKKKTTLLTSNLGFSEWGSFLHNKQLTAALISRLTEISYVINMKNCESLRPTLEQ